MQGNVGFRNDLERSFRSAGGGPSFTDPPNYFGNTPGLTYSRNSGPYFDANGNVGTKPTKDAAFAPFFGMPTKETTTDPTMHTTLRTISFPMA